MRTAIEEGGGPSGFITKERERHILNGSRLGCSVDQVLASTRNEPLIAQRPERGLLPNRFRTWIVTPRRHRSLILSPTSERVKSAGAISCILARHFARRFPEERLLASYEPTSRRPIADVFRRTARFAVEWCVRRDVHPDIVSYASVVSSAGAAACFWRSGQWPVLLIPAVVLCYLRLWFNMLDGMVALASGKASRTGEIINELPDRISDVLIFVGVAHSGLCHPLSAYWVAIFALLVAYVGTLGQAVGAQREFSGLMAKPWRMVALHVGAWTTLGLIAAGHPRLTDASGPTVLDVTHGLIVAGCVQTIWFRLVRIVRALRALPVKTKNHPARSGTDPGGTPV